MRAYAIRVNKDNLFATNADNLLDAEERFVEKFPEYKDIPISIFEINRVEDIIEKVEVF